jgi:double-stranded uracil-DNA glycosylase
MTASLIQDVLQPGLRVVFCGTALGNASAKARAYYAHPRNLFWGTLHKIGLTRVDAPLLPHEYSRVLEFGIGLTDLCKAASGNDADLPPGAFDVHALRDKIERHRPLFLAFTSKKAGRVFCGSKAEYGWQDSLFSATKIYVLPSTSPNARWQWHQHKHHWQTLAAAVQAVRL